MLDGLMPLWFILTAANHLKHGMMSVPPATAAASAKADSGRTRRPAHQSR